MLLLGLRGETKQRFQNGFEQSECFGIVCACAQRFVIVWQSCGSFLHQSHEINWMNKLQEQDVDVDLCRERTKTIRTRSPPQKNPFCDVTLVFERGHKAQGTASPIEASHRLPRHTWEEPKGSAAQSQVCDGKTTPLDAPFSEQVSAL